MKGDDKMRASQLSKYMKSRISKCIYCGMPITDKQEFEYCSTRIGRYVTYAFIHSDCIPKAAKYVQNKQLDSIRKEHSNENRIEGK